MCLFLYKNCITLSDNNVFVFLNYCSINLNLHTTSGVNLYPEERHHLFEW